MDGRAGETITATAKKAWVMLNAFANVGTRAFHLTLTDINGDEMPGGYKSNRSLEELHRTIGRLLKAAADAQHNVIIRPRHPKTALLVQLDDFDSGKAERIAPHAFMIIRTSPGPDGSGNFQAWVAVKDAPAEKE